jgi:hypothetical protein
LRNLKISHKDQTIETAPYKPLNEDVTTNTKHIIQKNNYTNTNLNTIEKQLTIIEKHIQNTYFLLLKLKNLLKKTQFSNHTKSLKPAKLKLKIKKYFLKAINDHLNHFEASSFTLIAHDTPKISNHP